MSTPFTPMSSKPYKPFYLVGTKSPEAIREKAQRKYDGNVMFVKDILRATITLPDEGSLVCALLFLHKICNDEMTDGRRKRNATDRMKIVRIKNLFRSSQLGTMVPSDLPTGYRHVLVNVRFEDGFLAEFQFNLEQMFNILGKEGYMLHKDIIAVQNPFHTEGRNISANTKALDMQQKKVTPISKTNPLLLCNCAEKKLSSTKGDTFKKVLNELYQLKEHRKEKQQGSETMKEKQILKNKSDTRTEETTKKKHEETPIEAGAARKAVVGGNKSINDRMPPKGDIETMAATAPRIKCEEAAPACGIASETAAAARKETVKTKGPQAGGIAAMAAAAARKKSATDYTPPAGGIVAIAAAAARKNSERMDNAPTGGIAAMAAAAARKKSIPEDTPPTGPPAGGIAAMAAAAARKQSETVDNATTGDIAAMAAAAARKKSETVDNATGGGIAAMAAAAAKKKSTFEYVATAGGIAAMAAAAARKKSETEGTSPVDDGPPAGGIAAMAAAAARKKSVSEDVASAGGITAMTAAAQQRRRNLHLSMLQQQGV
uniref:Uncharacterized protein n=1 Tax=Ditylum brightwellii TaxID=49249 RepID=A0A7S4QU69_9STRA